ncbi:MAG: putative glycoside hydrolase [Candidatus Margulisbacteria bacterium]|nr:putative glycoside hydrolase [Candidatus Margulisiibacteriota bacterium]
MRILIRLIIGLSLVVVFFFIIAFSFQRAGEESRPGKKRGSDKGIYVTAWVAQTPARFNYLKAQAKKAGINTIVVDGKDILSRPLVELAKEKKLGPDTKVSADPWLSKLAYNLHKDGFIVTVRLVVFKDDHLIIARPDLAVKIKGGGIYRDNKGGRWADPYSDEVRLYNALVAERAALSGADEVQFDYIRFPAEGRARDAYYSFEKQGVSKVDIINSFLKAVRERTSKYNVSIAVDIFGVTAWQSRSDIENLGQDLKKMAQYIDVLSPMFYPSHFHYGYDGYANPGAYPYHFVNSGVRRTKELLSGEAVAIVPWIQGFDLRSPNFGPRYIMEQVRACRDEGVDSFLIWNARNVYDVSFSALIKGR